MKKVYLILTLVILVSLVLPACGGQAEPVVEEPEPEVVELIADVFPVRFCIGCWLGAGYPIVEYAAP